MKVRELFTDASKWCQGPAVMDADGNNLNDLADPKACRWCLWGATATDTLLEKKSWKLGIESSPCFPKCKE